MSRHLLQKTVRTVAVTALAMTALPLLDVSVLTAHPAGLAAQEVELRLSFEEGSEHRYQIVTETRTETPMMEVSQQQSQVILQEVLGVTGEAADVRLTWENISVSQASPMGVQAYDSASDPDPVDAGMAMMAMLLGRSLEARITMLGETVEVRGLSELMDDMIAHASEMTPGAGGAAMREIFASMIDPQALVMEIQQPLPGHSVSPGDSWDEVRTINLPFGVATWDYRHTLVGFEDRAGRRMARIEMTGGLESMEPDASNPLGEIMELSDADISGWMELDLDRGLMLRRATTTQLTVSVLGQASQARTTEELELLEP
jgi:hypothetical protein